MGFLLTLSHGPLAVKILPPPKNSASQTRGDLVQWGCNLNRVMKTIQSPTRTRPMCRERSGHAPRQGGGEKREGMVWGGMLAESGRVLPLSARAIPDQARVFAIFVCQPPGRAEGFAISICEVAGRAGNFAISFRQVVGRAGNFAISFRQVVERAGNFAISVCEVAGRVCEVSRRAKNFAISVCEVVGRAENLAISVCEVAGRARNFAISFCEVAGRAENFAISFCEVAQRAGQGAQVAENRPGRNMNLMDGAGMNLRRGDRLADRRRMAHAALFHARAGRQGAASQRRGRHVPLILLGAGGFTAVSLCQHDNPEN